jgi:hypothetical protein
MTVPHRVPRKAQISACGVSFQPGGAGALFRPIDGTTDRVIDLAHFWGNDAARLWEELRHLETHEARLDRLETEIEQRVGDISEVRMLARGIERLNAGMPIKEVCRELALSSMVRHSRRNYTRAKNGRWPVCEKAQKRWPLAVKVRNAYGDRSRSEPVRCRVEGVTRSL